MANSPTTSQAQADRLREIDEADQKAERGECICDTCRGRESCLHVSHGDLWDAKCIDDGRKFFYLIRAKNKAEAEEIGREMAESNGEECYGVRRHRD